MWQTLKQLGMQHRQKLLITFAIVALENILFLVYPLFGSMAVNAVMTGKPWQALSYAALVLLMWSVGALRRSVDTRTFARSRHAASQAACSVIGSFPRRSP